MKASKLAPKNYVLWERFVAVVGACGGFVVALSTVFLFAHDIDTFLGHYTNAGGRVMLATIIALCCFMAVVLAGAIGAFVCDVIYAIVVVHVLKCDQECVLQEDRPLWWTRLVRLLTMRSGGR
jgi:hypothetical protein